MTFARSQPKPTRERDTPHLQFVRQFGCLLCAAEGHPRPGPSEAMHVSFLAPGGKGYGSKAPDRFTVPGCREHHQEQTNSGLRQVNEKTYWARTGIKVAAFCDDFYAVSGDLAAGEVILADYAHRARQLPPVFTARDLIEPRDASPKRVTVSAYLSDAPADQFGNRCIVLHALNERGARATVTAFVDPQSVEGS